MSEPNSFDDFTDRFDELCGNQRASEVGGVGSGSISTHSSEPGKTVRFSN
jgi:hypothetical protein